MFSLAKRYLAASLPTTILQVLTFATGSAILLIVISVSTQLTNNFSQEENGVDAIVGAKGSPLQLVLSGVYHADIPTGNIDYNEAMRLSRNNSVKAAVPISLGDSYKGYRIVGTTEDFLKFYSVSIAEGSSWAKPMEAIIGNTIAKAAGLRIGDSFVGSHGLVDGGEEHKHMPYKVVGILAKNGTVADRLVLTSLESVWEIHDHHHHDEEAHEEDNHHDDEQEEHVHAGHDEEREVTALLLQYNNRAASINFPRMVNKQTNTQAASPYFEIAKLFKVLGVGFDTAKIIGYVLLVISVLSIFLVLLGNVRKRHYDIAILRVTGATPSKIMQLVIFEGMILTVLGIVSGFIASRAALFMIGNIAAEGTGFSIQAGSITHGELLVMGLLLVVSLASSIIPALMAYRVNIVNLLLKRI
ncbi:MAG: ABC-type transport system, involved in lipoprotein release, permease component [Rickettsiaceae bacterium]|nr:ABC-type transport system, involved in lipoprotein release, permease component [Rickettsiaceae bacterium]